MGYTDKYLLEGEHVTYRTHLHWIIYIYPILLFIVSIVICGLAVKYCTPKGLFNIKNSTLCRLCHHGGLCHLDVHQMDISADF